MKEFQKYAVEVYVLFDDMTWNTDDGYIVDVPTGVEVAGDDYIEHYIMAELRPRVEKTWIEQRPKHTGLPDMVMCGLYHYEAVGAG